MTAASAHDAPVQDDRTLLRSQITCNRCHDTIASLHRHDFNWCHCKAVSIDGGRDYLRVGGDIRNFEITSIWVDGKYTGAEAGFILAVFKALGYAYMQELSHVTTSAVVKSYVGMRRPYMPAFYPTNLRKAVLHALKVLHQSHIIDMYDARRDEPLRGYMWKPCPGVKFCDRIDARF